MKKQQAPEASSLERLWSVRMDPGAELSLPASARGVQRTLYFFAGEALEVAGEKLEPGSALRLDASRRAP